MDFSPIVCSDLEDVRGLREPLMADISYFALENNGTMGNGKITAKTNISLHA